MLVSDLVSRDFSTAHHSATIIDLVKIFCRENTNGIFIVDENGTFEGLVTIFEVLQAIVPDSLRRNPNLAKAAPRGLFFEMVEKKKNEPAEKFMLKNVPVVHEATKIIEIAANSLQTEHYRLPVVDENGKLIGVVNRRILRDAMAEKLGISCDVKL